MQQIVNLSINTLQVTDEIYQTTERLQNAMAHEMYINFKILKWR